MSRAPRPSQSVPERFWNALARIYPRPSHARLHTLVFNFEEAFWEKRGRKELNPASPTQRWL
eukprot:3848158-Pyramimonas_sp.AAC.1